MSNRTRWRDWADAVRSRDPGLRRWHSSVHATVTWISIVATLTVLSVTFDVPVGYVVPGVLVVSVATMSLGMELTSQQRTRSLLLVPFSAAAALALGTWSSGSPLLTSVLFLGLGVLALGAFLLGMGAVLVAIGAIVACYATMLTTATWETYLGNVVSATVSAVISAAFLGGVFRASSRRDAPRLWQSVQASARRLTDAADSSRSRRVDDLLAAVTAARTHIARHPAAWPASFRTGGGAVLSMLSSDVVAAVTSGAAPRSLPDPVWPGPHDEAPQATTEPLTPVPGGRGVVSMGVQLFTATAAALIIAQLIDPLHWFWAVLAALVMLFGTTSAADAIGKGLRRVAGTIVALPMGLVLTVLADGNLVVLSVMVVVCMFAQQYLAAVAYAWSVFFLTLMLSLLFDLTGADTLAALEARVLLTILGALVGIVVARFVLPTRTGALLRARADGVFDAAVDVVAGIRDREEPTRVEQHAFNVERRLDVLRGELLASRAGWPLSRGHTRLAEQLEAGREATVQLRRVAAAYEVYPDTTPAVRDEAERARLLIVQARHRVDGEASTELPTAAADSKTASPLSREIDRLQLALRALHLQLTP